jgi:hypothetical protein
MNIKVQITTISGTKISMLTDTTIAAAQSFVYDTLYAMKDEDWKNFIVRMEVTNGEK